MPPWGKNTLGALLGAEGMMSIPERAFRRLGAGAPATGACLNPVFRSAARHIFLGRLPWAGCFRAEPAEPSEGAVAGERASSERMSAVDAGGSVSVGSASLGTAAFLGAEVANGVALDRSVEGDCAVRSWFGPAHRGTRRRRDQTPKPSPPRRRRWVVEMGLLPTPDAEARNTAGPIGRPIPNAGTALALTESRAATAARQFT